MFSRLQLVGFSLQSKVVTGLELVNSLLADVKTDYSAKFTEFDRERKSNVAKTYDGQFDILKCHALL